MAIVISGNGIEMGGNPISNASQIDSTVINENGESVATAVELASVEVSIPSSEFGGIGTYVIAGAVYPSYETTTSTTASIVLPGATVAGSALRYDTYQTNTAVNTANGLSANQENALAVGPSAASLGLTGTWRLMTPIKRRASVTGYYPVALWLRIA